MLGKLGFACLAVVSVATLMGADSAAAQSTAPTNNLPLDSALLTGGKALDAAQGWKYLPIAGAVCRNGSATGVMYRAPTNNAPSHKLLITFAGGVACYSGETCEMTRSLDNFDLEDARALANGTLQGGIWNNSDASNELGNVHQFIVPYCSGDLLAGDSQADFYRVKGFGFERYTEQFRGWNNVGKFLDYLKARIAPRLGSKPEVMANGISAGGYGLTLNANRVRAALPSDTRLTLLLDSSPPFQNDLFLGCQQKRFHDTWNLANTFMKECPECTSDNWLNPLFARLLRDQPNTGVALASYTNDAVIQSVAYAFTNPFTCSRNPTAAEYLTGLRGLRAQMMAARPQNNTATYFVDGFVTNMYHTLIDDQTYYNSSLATGIPSDVDSSLLTNGRVFLKKWTEAQLDHATTYPPRAPYYVHVGP